MESRRDGEEFVEKDGPRMNALVNNKTTALERLSPVSASDNARIAEQIVRLCQVCTFVARYIN